MPISTYEHEYSDGMAAVISCAALHRQAPDRVALFSPPLSRFPVYIVSEALCLGNSMQALCPVNTGGQPLWLLEESWGYEFEDSAAATARSLSCSPSGKLPVLEEAAPLCFPWAFNFWHWLFEGLPRVAVLESLGFSGKYIVPLSTHAMETMSIMRIPQHRIVWGLQPYFIKKMFVTTQMPPDRFTPATMEALHALFRRFGKIIPRLPGKKRVYVKRISNRKICNETEVASMLESMGFQTMVPEEQPDILSQLVCMSNAECSVMPHGANCALAFTQPGGSHMFELFGPGYVNNCNGPMVKTVGLHHHQLVGKSTGTTTFAPLADYEVDVDFLRYKLQDVLGS